MNPLVNSEEAMSERLQKISMAVQRDAANLEDAYADRAWLLGQLDVFLWLANLKVNSIHLERDGEHACNYMTAAEWIDGEINSCNADDFKDCDPEELQRMKDTNTIWSLQIFPMTPNGSVRWVAPTMLEVIAKAHREWPEFVRDNYPSLSTGDGFK